jgi:hypothetical protein
MGQKGFEVIEQSTQPPSKTYNVQRYLSTNQTHRAFRAAAPHLAGSHGHL